MGLDRFTGSAHRARPGPTLRPATVGGHALGRVVKHHDRRQHLVAAEVPPLLVRRARPRRHHRRVRQHCAAARPDEANLRPAKALGKTVVSAPNN